MKKSMCIIALLGMGTGAFLYSYCEKHPFKMKQMKNKVDNIMKDFK